MRKSKIISWLLAVSMLAVTAVPAFAAAPSAYDGQPYESVGYSSDDDPDGEINLAVIANGDVNIGGSMEVQGSIYSNGTIYQRSSGDYNIVNGLLISGTEYKYDVENWVQNTTTWNWESTTETVTLPYVMLEQDGSPVTNTGNIQYMGKPKYEGSITDKETSFDYTLPEGVYTTPEVSNVVEYKEANQWGNEAAGNLPITISESTRFNTLYPMGDSVTIDVSKGDVVVVIDNMVLGSGTPEFRIVGTEGNDNQAWIYINGFENPNDNMFQIIANINDAPNRFYTTGDTATAEAYMDEAASPDRLKMFVTLEDTKVGACHVSGDVYFNTNSLDFAGASLFNGHITTNAETFNVNDSAFFRGVVMAPYADSYVAQSGTIIGQLYTDTLKMEGWGRILYDPDKLREYPSEIPTPGDEPAPEATPEPTPEPTAEPTPEPTLPPLPSGSEIDVTGGYAYIFGYEPDRIQMVWVDDEEGGHTDWDIEVRMAPTDAVTREQVAAMIMRMIDQSYDTKNANYAVTPNMEQHAGTWYERGLAYLASKGTFDGVESVDIGPVTRGEVAKLVAFGLNLTDTTETTFADIENSPYKQYIEIMNAYGYMNGDSETEFAPDRIMNRAEFCSMFNNIIGRNDMGLEAQDGSTVTPQTYYLVDLPEGEWYTDIMLKATSAYDGDGLIDVDTRLSNIRNILDHYDSQNIA